MPGICHARPYRFDRLPTSPAPKHFIEAPLRPLGIAHHVHYEGTDGHADLIGFGSNGRMYFWLKQGMPQCRGHPCSASPPKPPECIAGISTTRPCAAGGRDNGPPGPRDHYDPRYHAAYVFDPDGYNVEAVYRDY